MNGMIAMGCSFRDAEGLPVRDASRLQHDARRAGARIRRPDGRPVKAVGSIKRHLSVI
jgi:hypothetical protein